VAPGRQHEPGGENSGLVLDLTRRAGREVDAEADTVSGLAAVVLYLVSIGDVRGFAFTLGLSTVCDLFVVIAFTYPLVTVLSRSP